MRQNLSSSLMGVMMFLSKSESVLSFVCNPNEAAFFLSNSRYIGKRTRKQCSPSGMLHRLDTELFFQDLNKDDAFHQSSDENMALQALNPNLIDDDSSIETKEEKSIEKSTNNFFARFIQENSTRGPPPMQIEDGPLLIYDVFLILNLSVSISFWVVHRLSFTDIIPAFSEGSLLCILWIIAGLWNGAFLYSAVDGHYDVTREEHEGKGGPVSAAMLGLSTFVGTANLRILVALGMAVLEHRKVGITNGEELIPLEIAFGMMLMSAWRMLHSSYSRF